MHQHSFLGFVMWKYNVFDSGVTTITHWLYDLHNGIVMTEALYGMSNLELSHS